MTPPFSVFEDNCSGVSLAPNASCTVVVRFKPTAVGSFSDSFDITSNDADEASLTVNVSGDDKGLNVTINKVDTSVAGVVRMIVSVTDGDNNPQTGLFQTDFAVSENSNPIAIASFDNTVQTAVSVALDLDFSDSFTGVQDDVKTSAKNFLGNLLAGDEAVIIKFAREIELSSGPYFPPSGFGTLLAALANLQAAVDAPFTLSTTSTKLYDAVFDSVDRLGLRRNDRLAALVLSDGVDFNGDTQTPGFSTHDLEDVIANAQDKHVFIFTIGLGADINTEVMQRMAVETGGQYFATADSTQLTAIYNQISEILTNQYEITFLTTRPDGSLNTLQVVVTHGGLDGDDTETVTY